MKRALAILTPCLLAVLAWAANDIVLGTLQPGASGPSWRLQGTDYVAEWGSAPAPWTPSNATVSLRLWIDCADTATVTVVTGSVVSAVADKSGLANNAAQTTDAYRPAWVTNGPGNAWAMVFDDSNDWLKIADHASLQFSTSNFAVWVVGDITDSNNWGTIVSKNYTGFELFHSYVANETRISSYIGGATATNYSFKTGAYIQDAWQIFSMQRQGAAIQQIYVDGLDAGTITTNTASASSAGRAIYIGGCVGVVPSYPLGGRVVEVVIVFGTLAEGEREKFEGYLAWKWGLEANLPAAHPYKGTQPTLD